MMMKMKLKSSAQDVSNPTDQVYTCSKRDCDFFLHKSCSDLPRDMEHKSHRITLISEPPEYSLYYNCNACGDLINEFSFHCNKCEDFRLHVKCTFLAESMDSEVHKHTLSVEYSSTEKSVESDFGDNMVLCDVCKYCLIEGYWFYCCKECDFCTHLVCTVSAEGPPEEVEEGGEEDLEGLSDQQRLMIATIKAND